MFKKLKLGFKLNLLLGVMLLLLIVTVGSILSVVIQGYAEQVIADRALMLIETMNSVRNYTNSQIVPELASRLETEELFLPQAVPAYSAREVFEHFRTNEEYREFFYKEATLNPTNLRDKADKFETEIIQSFQNNSNQQQQGFRSIPGGEIFYIARPMRVTQASCLRCHGTPEQAPASQIATYGSNNGFGWKIGELTGAQIISVPASRVFENARHLSLLIIGKVLIFLVIAVILLNVFLKYTITDPINKMSQLSKRLSTGDMNVEFDRKSNDEIGILAASLNRLKVSLKMALEMLDSK
ncbi:c-type heme family protein [Myxosarcina sp. GI1(2024)]